MLDGIGTVEPGLDPDACMRILQPLGHRLYDPIGALADEASTIYTALVVDAVGVLARLEEGQLD